ncbi:MAG: hypothetical protein LBJ12_09190 [Oscillospiraceae bacterium]|jgi:hypothetical protein|nr:hypothetical protein [Oscillospiraceae bacterium]
MRPDEALEMIAETGKMSRGGLESYGDMRKDKVQRVRGDFLTPTFKAKITFALDGVTFNMSCVNLFPGDQHIVINVDETNKRIIIEPCLPTDRDSLKFANLKSDRNKPRKCTARIFCAMIYDMMNWNRVAKYKSMAIFQQWGNKKIIVFNLDECVQVFTEIIASNDGKKKRSYVVNMPKEWKGRFGHTIEELDEKNRLDTTITLITVDNKTGERHASSIEPKLPTPEELMHRPYGGIRIHQEEDNEEN